MFFGAYRSDRKKTSLGDIARPLIFESLAKRVLLAWDVEVDSQMTKDPGNLIVYSNTARASIVQVADGGSVFEDLFTRDESQTLLFHEFGSVKGIDVSFDFRFPDGIPAELIGRESGSVKLSRLNPPDGAPSGHSMQNHLQFYTQSDGTVRYEIGFYVEASNFSDDIYFELDPSEFTQIRYLATYNSPGKSDGSWKVWINDKLVVDRTNVLFAYDPEHLPISMWVGGNISFGGEDPKRSFRRQIDNVKVVVYRDVAQETGTRVVFEDGKSGLIVEGTETRDTFYINAKKNGDVLLWQNGVEHRFQKIDFVNVKTFGGEDSITVDSEIPVEVDSGSGNDYVYSSSALAYIYGGLGNDTLIAYRGSQIIVGGEGGDNIVSIATEAPHVIASGELSAPPIVPNTANVDALFEDDGAIDSVFAIGFFEPVLIVSTTDRLYKWKLRR